MKYFLAALLLIVTSCEKDKSCEFKQTDLLSANATIVWSGGVELDGCDWTVRIDSTTFFHPDNLTAEFKQDQLPVQIVYYETEKSFACGLGSMPEIHLLNIKK